MMGRKKQLSKRQLAVIEEMFSGELDEQAVVDKQGAVFGIPTQEKP